MMHESRDPRITGLLRYGKALASLSLTIAALWWATRSVDANAIMAVFADLRWPEFCLLAALVPLQSAWAARRWVLSSRAAGVPVDHLPVFSAYYLGILANQLLPGGIAGDATRVWRQKRDHAQHGWTPTLVAFACERGAGIFCTLVLATLGLALWPAIADSSQSRPPWVWGSIMVLWSLVFTAAIVLWALARSSRAQSRVRALVDPLAACLWRTPQRCEFWWSSMAFSASLVVSILIAAQALTIELGVLGVSLLPLVVLSMSIPWLHGGWGGRELTAVTLLPVAGVAAADALALSVLYGLAVFAGSLPALALMPSLRASQRNSPAASPRMSWVARPLREWPGMPWLAGGLLIISAQCPRWFAEPESFEFIVRLPRTESAVDWSVLFVREGMGMDPWRVHGELLVAIALLVGLHRMAASPWMLRGARWLVATTWGATLLWELNVLGGQLIMHQVPLVYDELFLLLHLGVLVFDLLSLRLLVLIGLGFAALALLFGSGHLAARLLEDSARTQRSRRGQPQMDWLATAVVVAFSCASMFAPGVEWSSRERSVAWVSAQVADNLVRSYEHWKTVDRTMSASPYKKFAELMPQTKPKIALYIIESYGRVVAEHPQLNARWREDMRALDERLGQHEWQMRSGYSRAPVSGGRSWMADGSMFTGQKIAHESTYRHMLRNIRRVPNFVHFLDGIGYETIRLAPADRSRPGIVIVDEWGYDRMLTFDNMEYRGDLVGWGRIPDQYSLGFIAQQVDRLPEAQPWLLYFHMVSAHAPWETMPPVVDDWRSLQTPGVASGRSSADSAERAADRADPTGVEVWLARAERFKRRSEFKTSYMGKMTDLRAARYYDAVRYDFEVVARRLESDETADIVIVMGDHQPPMITRHAESFDVPVHVLARDPRWLREFEARGFAASFYPGRHNLGYLRHEDLFAAFVRTIVRGNDIDADAQGLPEGAVP